MQAIAVCREPGQTGRELSIFKLVFFSRASCTSTSHRIVGQSIFRADWFGSDWFGFLLPLQLPPASLSLEEIRADALAHSRSPPLQLSSWCRNLKKPFAQTPRLFRLFTLFRKEVSSPRHILAYYLVLLLTPSSLYLNKSTGYLSLRKNQR